jgi:hypothetical protein
MELRGRCQFRQTDVLEDERAAVRLRNLPFLVPKGQILFVEDIYELYLYEVSQPHVHL